MSTNTRLEEDHFLKVISGAPLVSIDLVVRNSQEQVLLGLRTNPPAKGMWFVPGGRVRKNERLEQAFDRIIATELGPDLTQALSFKDAVFLGVYQHFYPDNALQAPNVSTHYVALGYELMVTAGEIFSADLADQHSQQKWWSVDEMLAASDVHFNTKAYIDHTYAE